VDCPTRRWSGPARVCLLPAGDSGRGPLIARSLGRQAGPPGRTILYLVIEYFNGDPVSVYRRFREQGRMAPEGLRYVQSWVTEDLQRCFQIMECDDPTLLSAWMDRWRDLVTFEVPPVMTSADAAATMALKLCAAQPAVADGRPRRSRRSLSCPPLNGYIVRQGDSGSWANGDYSSMRTRWRLWHVKSSPRR